MIPRLRHTSDSRTLWTLGLAGATLIFSLAWSGSWYVGGLLFAINVFLGLMSHVINHNVSHHPLFVNERHNRGVFLYLSWLMGIPAAPIAASHIHNHHVHNNDESDWMRSTVLGRAKGAKRLAKYLRHVFTLPRLSQRDGHEQIPATLWQRMRVENVVVLATLLLMLTLSPVSTLIFYVLARLTSMSLLFLINLVQHDGLEHAEGVNRCRNFISPLSNFLMFNNGYHSAHHLRPGAYWSEYPAIHQAQVTQKLRAELTQRSLAYYILTHYLWTSPETNAQCS